MYSNQLANFFTECGLDFKIEASEKITKKLDPQNTGLISFHNILEFVEYKNLKISKVTNLKYIYNLQDKFIDGRRPSGIKMQKIGLYIFVLGCLYFLCFCHFGSRHIYSTSI